MLTAAFLVVPATAEPRSITQYRHTAWSGVEVGGAVLDISQGQDGLLSLVTSEGLRLYDGENFQSVPARMPDGAAPPNITRSLITRSGDLWVGFFGSAGVAVLRDGVMVDQGFPNAQRQIVELEEGRDGSIWAVSARPDESLARWQNGRWVIYGEAAGLPDGWIFDVRIDRSGVVWVAAMNYVARLRPGEARFEILPVKVEGGPGLAEDAYGRMWLGDNAGVRRLPTESAKGLGRPYATPTARRVRIAFGPDGDLWGALDGGGVFKLDPNDGSVTQMTQQQSLTGDDTLDILVDRERVVWVGTQFGLDAFVRTPVVEEQRVGRFSENLHMAQDQAGLVYVLGEGSLWTIGPNDGPRRIRQDADPTSGFCASTNGVLLMHDRFLERFKAGRVVERLPLDLPPNLCCCVEDAERRLWVVQQSGALTLIERGVSVDESARLQGRPAKAVHLDGAGRAHAADWDGGLYSLFDGRQWRADQLGIGPVMTILSTSEGLLVGGQSGIARIGRTNIDRLTSAAHPWLASVRDMLETANGDLWAFTTTGIARLTAQDLALAFRQPDRPAPHLLFNRLDGVFSVAARGDQPKMSLDQGGRLWVLGRRGLMRMSLDDLGYNQLAPPVTIRGMMAAGIKLPAMGDLIVPPGANPIQIDFVAGSLRTPERVAYRYKLEGVDKDWVEAGSRRFAVYGRLPPGKYRFQVIGSNDDGVWNTQGAVLAFQVRPYFWQTWWFVSLSVLALALLTWSLYRLRLYAASGRIRAMLDERMRERERIARDLHDTLMQGVQALILRIQIIADDLPRGSKGRDDLDQALDRADIVLAEARESVLDLRQKSEGIDERLRRLVAEGQKQHPQVVVTLDLVGSVGCLDQEIADEIVGVAREALTNALVHAQASHVTVRFETGVWRSVLSIDDDGQGVPAAVLAAGARAGHFGLPGMRERAGRIRGRITLTSGAHGTRVSLIGPGQRVSWSLIKGELRGWGRRDARA
ncbi:MAG: triple tyrosine motif-containing protein [Brevundimonas sp.]